MTQTSFNEQSDSETVSQTSIDERTKEQNSNAPRVGLLILTRRWLWWGGRTELEMGLERNPGSAVAFPERLGRFCKTLSKIYTFSLTTLRNFLDAAIIPKFRMCKMSYVGDGICKRLNAGYYLSCFRLPTLKGGNGRWNGNSKLLESGNNSEVVVCVKFAQNEEKPFR